MKIAAGSAETNLLMLVVVSITGSPLSNYSGKKENVLIDEMLGVKWSNVNDESD